MVNSYKDRGRKLLPVICFFLLLFMFCNDGFFKERNIKGSWEGNSVLVADGKWYDATVDFEFTKDGEYTWLQTLPDDFIRLEGRWELDEDAAILTLNQKSAEYKSQPERNDTDNATELVWTIQMAMADDKLYFSPYKRLSEKNSRSDYSGTWEYVFSIEEKENGVLSNTLIDLIGLDTIAGNGFDITPYIGSINDFIIVDLMEVNSTLKLDTDNTYRIDYSVTGVSVSIELIPGFPIAQEIPLKTNETGDWELDKKEENISLFESMNQTELIFSIMKNSFLANNDNNLLTKK